MRRYWKIFGGFFGLAMVSLWAQTSTNPPPNQQRDQVPRPPCVSDLQSPDLNNVPRIPEPYVNDLLRKLNFKGSVESSRRGAGMHDMFKPDVEAVLYEGRTDPKRNLVIDVGIYDGMDVSFPAFRNGYTVVAFELMKESRDRSVNNWEKNGLVRDKDFSLIPADSLLIPLSPRNLTTPHIFLIEAGASSVNQIVRVAGVGVLAKVIPLREGEQVGVKEQQEHTLRVDSVVPSGVEIFWLKTDCEGHDGHAVQGAAALIARRQVASIQLEFRPRGMREQGSDPIELLQWLWDRNFQCYDMNTHPGYKPVDWIPKNMGLARGVSLKDFVGFLDKVPLGPGPAGDAMGGWEDLFCTCPPD